MHNAKFDDLGRQKIWNIMNMQKKLLRITDWF